MTSSNHTASVLVEGAARSTHADLAQVALELTRATALQHILELSTMAAQDVIGTHQAVTSRLRNGWADATTYVSLSDKYASYRDYDQVPKGFGVLNAVTRENRPLRLTGAELASHPEWRGLRDAPGHPPMPDYLAAPLVARGGGNLGLIQLTDKVDGTPFSAEDEGMLVQVAQMTSAAIENVELIERERRERHLAETLHALGTAINRGRELSVIVQEVTDACTELAGARFGAFFYNSIDSAGEQLLLYTLSGAPREAFDGFGHPRPTPIFRPTFEGTRVMRIDDVTTHEGYGQMAPHHGMPEGHLPVRSYLAVPVMLSDGSVAGGLFFGHPEPARFTAEHERLVVGVAAHAAIAIENVRLLDRERWAREQAEERAQAALSLRHVADGVFLVDRDGYVRVWNPAAERITGVAAAAIIGRRACELVDGWEHLVDELPTSEHPVAGAAPESPARILPITFDGREAWVSIHGVAFEEGTVYAFRDMTAERHLEQIRADMIATVSHELRTPLASVYGAARTLQRTDVDIDSATRDVLVDMVATECERLSGIVDEFLLASSLDGRADLSTEPVELGAVVREAALIARARDLPDVEVVERVEQEPLLVEADGGRVRQVVTNLVDNALKYGASGGRIEIAAERTARGCSVRVRDEGPGIPTGEHERVFERFYRLDPQLSRGIRGTGLGLYISRELIVRMGGTLNLDSRAGGPTTFTLELPAAR